MSHPALDEVQCPICIDTLKKPIRILSCGHNLCQSCLVDLCSGKGQRRCPTCRQRIQLKSSEVETLPRNHIVEKMIDKLQDDVSQIKISQTISSPSQHAQLKDIVESLMREQKYKQATEILTTLISQTELLLKVPLMIQKSKCLLKADKVEEAKQVCVEMIAITDSSKDATDIKKICEGSEKEIFNIAKRFLEKKECGVGVGLVNLMFKLVKCSTHKKNKLYKLRDLGDLMQTIAIEMSARNRRIEFKPQLKIMHEMLGEMQSIDAKAHIKSKCLAVTWFLKYFGYCCNEVKEYEKSIEIYKQAISGMMTVFGIQANTHYVLGKCYNNLGWAYENTKQLSDAKASYTKAINI